METVSANRDIVQATNVLLDAYGQAVREAGGLGDAPRVILIRAIADNAQVAGERSRNRRYNESAEALLRYSEGLRSEDAIGAAIDVGKGGAQLAFSAFGGPIALGSAVAGAALAGVTALVAFGGDIAESLTPALVRGALVAVFAGGVGVQAVKMWNSAWEQVRAQWSIAHPAEEIWERVVAPAEVAVFGAWGEVPPRPLAFVFAGPAVALGALTILGLAVGIVAFIAVGIVLGLGARSGVA